MNEIDRWFESGAGVQDGLRLLSVYAPNRHIEKLVKGDSRRFGYLLSDILGNFASRPRPSRCSDAAKVSGFRENWPFLADPDCPDELKILAADKITAWQNYVDAHEDLWLCATPEQCFETAKKVIKNFDQNRKILSEFSHYREHHSILGEHPIFKERERMFRIREMTVSELVRRQKNLKDAIWRTEALIRNGDKPHLRAAREDGIAEKRRLLAETERMIADYEQRREKRTERH